MCHNLLMSSKAAEIENNVAEAVDNLFQLRENMPETSHRQILL